jgi:AraC-like DNA-binding protein
MPALHAVCAGNLFEALSVSASVWDGVVWRPIHVAEDVLWFEVEHGVKAERYAYNARSIARALKTRQAVLGEHAGLSDFFVPVVEGKRVLGVLVTGPFATVRPTSGSILERWRWLTGRQGHSVDPEFSHYLNVMLSTLVLEGGQVQSFERVLALLTQMMSGNANVRAAEVDALRIELEKSREVDEMWKATRSMIDDKTSRSWSSADRQPWKLGLERFPDQASVGLAVSRDQDRDPIEDLVQRDAFQRACAKLARKRGNTVAGKVGDHGVMFLSAVRGRSQRKRQELLDLGDKVAALARGFGLRLHLGLAARSSGTLSENYQASLAAAENALSRDARFMDSPGEARRPTFLLHRLEQQLGEIVRQNPEALSAHFDRYLEAVSSNYGHRLEPMRIHLSAFFERATAGLLDSAALDDTSLRDLYQELEPSARDADTVTELLVLYRRAVSYLSKAVERPTDAHRDRALSRALVYIHQHYAEKLRLAQVARVAGFAPNYFSALLKKREKMTFEHYVQKLRIERAKLLLGTRELEVRQVARLSGFRESHYFSRVFQRAVGMSPVEFRRVHL